MGAFATSGGPGQYLGGNRRHGVLSGAEKDLLLGMETAKVGVQTVEPSSR